MNTPKIFATSAALVLAALGFSGCGAGDTTTASPSSGASTVTAVQESTAPASSGSYVESNGLNGLTNTAQVKDEELRAALESASAAGEPLYIEGEQVYWLDRNISYAERKVVEVEASKDWQEHGIRGVEGFGTGELTIYRHDAKLYKVPVEQK